MKRTWSQAVVALCAFTSFAMFAPSQAAIVTLDFTTDDGGKSLVHGQVIATNPATDAQPGDPVAEFGNIVAISTQQGSTTHKGAVIFDTTPGGLGATLGDPDLDLLVNRGNILTLQDFRSPNKTNTGAGANGYVFNNPDDTRDPDPGSIVFTFLQPIAPISVDIVDADVGFEMDVILTDVHGGSRIITVPERWTWDIIDDLGMGNGFDTLVLNTIMGQDGEGPGGDGIEGNADDYTTVADLNLDDQNVVSIEFKYRGEIPNGWSSGGVDNLTFDLIPEPSSIAMVVIAGAVGLALRRRLARG
ncbi:PEP-CTERM sorting domain-containing protein [Aeoliella sp. SH292]|uniref:PEP-CTERM sorting domain-containing protein n=1 Tax=Aeoliella sp. SH292 TaxID=3454464 RepID=UPI003F95413F